MPFEARVVDVSVYQGAIDWAQVAAAGVYAAVIRAGYGRYAKQEDLRFAENYADARATGLPVGAYWFSYAKTAEEAKLEAQVCLQVLDNREFLMPVYFDQEESSIPVANRTACAVAFMDYIKANSNYVVGYYSYTSYMPSVDLDVIQQHCDTIWLADYRSNYDKTIPRDMHQYSSSGSVYGISGRVDLNNLFRDFPNEIKGVDKPVFTSDTLQIGPASTGDLKTITNMATGLGIGVTQDGDYLIVGPMSAGDCATISNKAIELGLGCADYTSPIAPVEPDEPENPVSPETPSVDFSEVLSAISALDSKVQSIYDKLNAVFK